MTYLFSNTVIVANEVEVKNDAANTLPISIIHEGNVVNHYNEFPVTLSAGASDAFGRLRVSLPFTLGDYKHLYGLDPNFIDKLDNGGTITFLKNQACAKLATNAHPSSNVIHQTKMYHHYMPGKSQLVKSTFNFYSNTTNVVKRTGYFDDYNGIYFEQDGNGVLSFCIRTDVSGLASDARKIPQSQWNVDKCDGTGPSKFNLDITKTQILFIDFQWLGVGRVRCGFVHDGIFIPAHEFYNSNQLDTVYMSNPNLPVRCEIRNVGATTGANLDQICSTVISEGGYVESGQDWAVTTANARVITSGQTLPVMAIKLSPTLRGYPNRATVRIGSVDLYSTTSTIKFSIVKLPDEGKLTGGTWSNVNLNSAVQYNEGATAYTDGEIVDAGFVAASAGAGLSGKSIAGISGQRDPSTAKKNFITQNYFNANSEIFAVVVTNISADSTSVSAAVQWREVY